MKQEIYRPSVGVVIERHLRIERIKRHALIVEAADKFAANHFRGWQIRAVADQLALQRSVSTTAYYVPEWILDLKPYTGRIVVSAWKGTKTRPVAPTRTRARPGRRLTVVWPAPTPPTAATFCAERGLTDTGRTLHEVAELYHHTAGKLRFGPPAEPKAKPKAKERKSSPTVWHRIGNGTASPGRPRPVDIDDEKRAARNRNDKRRFPAYLPKAEPAPATDAQREELSRQPALVKLIRERCRVPAGNWLTPEGKSRSQKTGRVFRFMMTKAGNVELAAEITTLTIQVAVKQVSRGQYKDLSTDKRVDSWLFGIAENKWKDHLDHVTQKGTLKMQTYSPLMDELTDHSGAWDNMGLYKTSNLRKTAKNSGGGYTVPNEEEEEAVHQELKEYREANKNQEPELTGNLNFGNADEAYQVPRDKSGFGPVWLVGLGAVENHHLDPRCFPLPWTIYDLENTPDEVTLEDSYLTPKQRKRKEQDIYNTKKLRDQILRVELFTQTPEKVAEMMDALSAEERALVEHEISKYRRTFGEDVYVKSSDEYELVARKAKAEDARERGEQTRGAKNQKAYRERLKQLKAAAE